MFHLFLVSTTASTCATTAATTSEALCVAQGQPVVFVVFNLVSLCFLLEDVVIHVKHDERYAY